MGGSSPTMAERVREVAPIRKVAQGGEKSHTESTVESVEEKYPREWVPVDSPQVPAGEGRLGKQPEVDNPIAKVGVQLKSLRKAESRVPGRRAHHAGGCRRCEEEHMVAQWFGRARYQLHHHQDVSAFGLTLDI